MTDTEWFELPIVAESEGPYSNWGEKYGQARQKDTSEVAA